MNAIALFGTRMVNSFLYTAFVSRKLCDFSFNGDKSDDGFHRIEESLKTTWKNSDFDSFSYENSDEENFSLKRRFLENARIDAARVLDILRQDGPGFDAKAALSELHLRVSGLLVRIVLQGILRITNSENETRYAILGSKFFVWAGQQENFRHTTNSYHLMMKIFAECKAYSSMWRLHEEMVNNGFPTTARTFNLLICSCSEAGLAMKVVERFIKSKTFNYRPFKHSYNAILHSLLAVRRYRLIEWVHQQMLVDGHCPDILTYNILLCAKYRLGKLHHFKRLRDEMLMSGLSPDIHTYNILLHILGKSGNPVGAIQLLNHMKDSGFDPSIMHITTLIDGLSRAQAPGKLDVCRYFFDDLIKNGCMPDVVCYTVMITGYITSGELEKAVEMFNEMIDRGQLPNAYTYNSMIRGFCMAGRFEEACSMLKVMESRGCNPNLAVYNTLLRNLQNAGKLTEAHDIMKQMEGKGIPIISKFKGYR